MNLWGVFATGLVSGGASCVAAQGGLLAGAVARRRHAGSSETAERGRLAQVLADDAAPVGGFLAGKLVSHVAFGALLGMFGHALQPSFRVRSGMQIGAGILMILMAASLAGLLGKRSFVPSPPKSLQRLVRRSARAETTLAPAMLGFLTVLVPCGITLSVEFLVITTGSPVTGAAAMGLFVLGTSPLFAVVGYAMRRATTVLRGHLTKLAAVAVAVAGLLSINSGLALRGSAFTLAKVAPGISAAVPPVLGGGRAATEGLSGNPSGSAAPVARAAIGTDGAQVVEIAVGYGDMAGGATPYNPSVVQARPGIPTRLKFLTSGLGGCAGVVVLQGRGIEKALNRDADTVIDLGVLSPGSVSFTCGTGMYGGTINVVAD